MSPEIKSAYSSWRSYCPGCSWISYLSGFRDPLYPWLHEGIFVTPLTMWGHLKECKVYPTKSRVCREYTCVNIIQPRTEYAMDMRVSWIYMCKVYTAKSRVCRRHTCTPSCLGSCREAVVVTVEEEKTSNNSWSVTDSTGTISPKWRANIL